MHHASIPLHRTGSLSLCVLSCERRPLAHQRITLRQTRHRFLFGCNLFPLGSYTDPGREALYRQRFSDLLNYATLPFYWSGHEPEEGQVRVERVRKMADWCRASGIRAKGHTLAYHQTVPAWAQVKTPRELQSLQVARVGRDVQAFAGSIDTWDVVNEVVWTPRHEQGKHPLARVCRRMGRVGFVKACFESAAAANPAATLLINDCDPVPEYHRLCGESLAAGVPIHAIGIQSHMHKGCWGPEKTARVCDHYARHGRPLHFSEVTILSGMIQPDHSWTQRRDDWFSTPEGEAQQAEQVVELYRLLFAHPAVEAITWWDLADDRAWLGAPAGLLRKDLSPKPAYEALMKLIKGEWWTSEQALTTDREGRVTVSGVRGDYEIRCEAGRAVFTLDRGHASEAAVTLQQTT